MSPEAIQQNFQDDEEFAAILARAGLWAATHPQQIAKGVEIGIKAAPTVIGGVKKGIDWLKHHDDENDDEFFLPAPTMNAETIQEQDFQDDEEFAALLVRAGLWAATHPQQIAKGVEIGVKAAPAVIGGVKKGIDWIKHHDDENDDEFFAHAPTVSAETIEEQDFQDDEEFAAILARAGLWAATHPQQVAKGVEIGIKAAPVVIGGVKKGINWLKHHDDENDDEFMALEGEEDNELFAPIVARAGMWAATHPQQVARGIEAGVRAGPAIVGGAKKAYNWVRHHDDENDNELFAEDDELFAPIVARAGMWAATHPQQVARGIEAGARAGPAIIGGAKKAYNWVRHHDDENDNELFAEDDELFAPIVARAGIWAATHPQQVARGIEAGARAAPAIVGGVKKGIDWIKHHDDDEFFTAPAPTMNAETIQERDFQDDEEFAALLVRAGLWAATHPQQIAKGVEIGVKAAPAVIGGVKKGIDWIKHHDDDEFFAAEKPKKTGHGQKFRGGQHHVEKPSLEQLGDLIVEGRRAI